MLGSKETFSDQVVSPLKEQIAASTAVEPVAPQLEDLGDPMITVVIPRASKFDLGLYHGFERMVVVGVGHGDADDQGQSGAGG